MPNIYSELEERWREVYATMNREPPSLNEFQRLLSVSESKARERMNDALQPQLGIFEFGLEWLAHIHVALTEKDGSVPRTETARATWALIGSAVAFGLSIRLLCLSGFDTPARALLRTYVETLLLCIVVLHDPSLAKAYTAARSDLEIKNFWHTSASPKNLHRRIIEIETLMGFDTEIVKDLREWRREEYEIMSQSSHLSYVGAALASMSPKIDEPETIAPSIVGLASTMSIRTITYAAQTTWYFSRMSFAKLVDTDPSHNPIVLDKENDWHQRIVAGRDVLGAMTDYLSPPHSRSELVV